MRAPDPGDATDVVSRRCRAASVERWPAPRGVLVSQTPPASDVRLDADATPPPPPPLPSGLTYAQVFGPPAAPAAPPEPPPRPPAGATRHTGRLDRSRPRSARRVSIVGGTASSVARARGPGRPRRHLVAGRPATAVANRRADVGPGEGLRAAGCAASSGAPASSTRCSPASGSGCSSCSSPGRQRRPDTGRSSALA